MIENKRFTMVYGKYIDNENNIEYDEKLESWKICELLNSLSEENKQLRNTIARLQLINDKLRDKDYTNYKKKIQELQEENKRLKKKEIERCRDWLNSDKNDYQLTLAFIKNKGYSLKDVLEYKKELK